MSGMPRMNMSHKNLPPLTASTTIQIMNKKYEMITRLPIITMEKRMLVASPMRKSITLRLATTHEPLYAFRDWRVGHEQFRYPGHVLMFADFRFIVYA